MKKGLTVGVVLLFIGISFVPSIAQTPEKQPIPTSSGKWWYVGGSGPGNYTDIQDAVDNASNGDTVYVYTGIYNRIENKTYCVDLNKSIHLVGEDKNTTILNGTCIWEVVDVEADNAEFNGFTVKNSKPGTGILIYNWSNGERKNIVLHDTILVNNSEGITIAECSNITCYDNIFITNGDGCYFFGSGDCSILHNLFLKNGIGLYSTYSGVTMISKNEFRENTNGIYCAGSNIRLTMRSNNFINNTIQASYDKQGMIWQLPLFIFYRQHWSRNYWSDWEKLTPRPIQGRLLLDTEIISRYITIPSFEFDRIPTQKPYQLNFKD